MRRSTGQRLYTAYRRLSQFYHVLHRLLVPRHPPNALTSLTTETVEPQNIKCSRIAGRWPSHHPPRNCEARHARRTTVVSFRRPNCDACFVSKTAFLNAVSPCDVRRT